jgi:hypothetical protein
METDSTLYNIIIVAIGYILIVVFWPKLCKVKGTYKPPPIEHPLHPITPLKPPLTPSKPLEPHKKGVPGEPLDVKWKYDPTF